MFEDGHRKRLEVTAELLNLVATVTLMQFCRGGEEYDEDSQMWISILFITTLALLTILSIAYAVLKKVEERRDQRRLTELYEAAWQA